MNAIAKRTGIFKSTDISMIEALVLSRDKKKLEIEQAYSLLSGDSYLNSAISYLTKAYDDKHRFMIGSKEKAVKILDADYWNKALMLTDVFDFMPEKRRSQWYDSIRNLETPEFEIQTAINTITDLLNGRMNFLAEKVEGIFRALSGDHVTNKPFGFSEKMIFQAFYPDNYGYINVPYDRCGYLQDLRNVILRLRGMDEIKLDRTSEMFKKIYKKGMTGQAFIVDDGSIRMKVFKKGTVHVEVNPDIAWQLNEILATLYPQAMPSRFRSMPAKKSKEFELMDEPIPSKVIDIIWSMLDSYHNRYLDGNYMHLVSVEDKHIRQKYFELLEDIGGIIEDSKVIFDYKPRDVLEKIAILGSRPEKTTHQFYPTPIDLVKEMIDLAKLDNVIGLDCLEPSAGHGNIASMMPNGSLCVEVSEVNCEILRSKGLDVTQDDFLNFAKNTDRKFKRIVMNPPFSQGRAALHINAAISLLEENGKLVALAPASVLANIDSEVTSSPVSFQGVSIDMIMLLIEK